MRLSLLILTADSLNGTIESGENYWRALDWTWVPDSLPPDVVLQTALGKIRSNPGDSIWSFPRLFVLAENRSIVGSGIFKRPPDRDGAVEIGYGVAESERGQGYATTAVRLLIAQAFDSHSVAMVYALVNPDNRASVRVLEKAGMSCAGKLIHPEDGLMHRYEVGRHARSE